LVIWVSSREAIRGLNVAASSLSVVWAWAGALCAPAGTISKQRHSSVARMRQLALVLERNFLPPLIGKYDP